MSRINEFINEISEHIDDTNYTPETLAWKLLFDSNIESFSSQLLTFTDEASKETEPMTYLFEVLITIFMEMIIGILKTNFYSDELNKDKEFNPKFNHNDFEEIIPLLKTKFDLINILLFTEKIEPTEDNKFHNSEVHKNKYCRIIMKHNKDDFSLFTIYGDRVAEDKIYHMILNSKFILTNKTLNSVYAVAIIDGITYRIYFSTR
jgi:hypothetical protein